MWGNRRNKKKITQIDSLIGKETLIKGDILFTGGLHIDGKVKGNISATEDSGSVLTLSERGVIEGEVRVPNVILNGKVIGNVYVAENVELAVSARIFGNVYYNLIEMAMGAEVNGSLIHSGDSTGKPPLPLGHDGKKEVKGEKEQTKQDTV